MRHGPVDARGTCAAPADRTRALPATSRTCLRPDAEGRRRSTGPVRRPSGQVGSTRPKTAKPSPRSERPPTPKPRRLPAGRDTPRAAPGHCAPVPLPRPGLAQPDRTASSTEHRTRDQPHPHHRPPRHASARTPLLLGRNIPGGPGGSAPRRVGSAQPIRNTLSPGFSPNARRPIPGPAGPAPDAPTSAPRQNQARRRASAPRRRQSPAPPSPAQS